MVFLQNHDQVGNRARRRPDQRADIHRADKIGAVLVLLAPFVPMLFMGEEWAASSPVPVLHRPSRPRSRRLCERGRRHEFAAFGWEPDDVPDPQAGRDLPPLPSRLGRARDRDSTTEMLEWYRELIGLRRALPSLSDGDRSHVRTRF